MTTYRKITCLFVFLIPFCTIAELDSAGLKEFYLQHEQKYRDEYNECADDTTKISLKKILLWRQHIHEIAESPAYRLLARDYMKKTGNTRDVAPCRVIKWHEERMAALAKADEESVSRIHENDEILVDSLIVADNIENNETSDFDFGRIPFGVSKAAFKKIFIREYRQQLNEMGSYFYAAAFPFDNKSYLAAFYFSKAGRFCRYEFECPDHEADSLNQITRFEAAILLSGFEKKLGEADQRLRVTFFDIKPGEITPVARWYKAPYTAFVGFSASGHRHYAKAIVIKEGL